MADAGLAAALATLPTRLLLGRPLGILMYHSVAEVPPSLPDWCVLPAERFQAQMRWLSRQPVDVLPLDDAVAALRAGRLRQPTIAITFDDGYRNNVEVALPILKRYGFPATVFLTTGFIGRDRTLWYARVVIALACTKKTEIAWRGLRLPLRDEGEKKAASAQLQAAVKVTAGAAPWDAAAEIETLLGTPIDPPVPEDSPFAILDGSGARAAEASGLIRFGAHTVRHPILSRLDDAALAAEIDESVAAVAELTGAPCTSFAYPNGGAGDFDERAVARLRAIGVGVAVTTQEAPNLRAADPLRLARWHVGATIPTAGFRAKALNLHESALRAAMSRHS